MVEKEYAQALLELASEHKILNRVSSELEALSKLLKDNEFKLFLESPSIQVEDKKNLLKNTLKDFNEITNNFLFVLLDNKRFDRFEGIYNEFNNLVLNSKSIVSVKLYSHIKLSNSQIEKLIGPIEAKLNSKNIKLENIVDSSLIGGIVIYANDTTIDLSTKGILNDLKESL